MRDKFVTDICVGCNKPITTNQPKVTAKTTGADYHEICYYQYLVQSPPLHQGQCVVCQIINQDVSDCTIPDLQC